MGKKWKKEIRQAVDQGSNFFKKERRKRSIYKKILKDAEGGEMLDGTRSQTWRKEGMRSRPR